MAARLAHRGPDGQATWHDATAGLAFARLAIIDLAERSMQPRTSWPQCPASSAAVRAKSFAP